MRKLIAALLCLCTALCMCFGCSNPSQNSSSSNSGSGTSAGGSSDGDQFEDRITDYLNPVFSPVFADPCIIRGEDGYFYAYATEDYGSYDDIDRVGYLPIIKSKNLVEWEYVGDVFSEMTKPTWGSGYSAGTWAPDVVKIGDKYNLYYSLSTWDDVNPGIGVCTADSPAGPWTDHGKVLDNRSSGANHSIDSFVFEFEGMVYMIWGSYAGLYMIELTDDGLAVKEGAELVIVSGSTTWSAFEGAYMIKEGSYYYLFCSLGNCCPMSTTTYYVNVMRSKSPLGPWVDSEGRDIKNNQTAGELVVKGSDDVKGPGHNCAIKDDNGDWWLIYHGYETKYALGTYGSSPRRALFIDKLLWDENGFPYVEGYAPSYERKVAPYFKY